MQFIGGLGNTRHFRCEYCGLDYSASGNEADPLCCEPDLSQQEMDSMDDFADYLSAQCVDTLCDCDQLHECDISCHGDPDATG